jgi:prepilin-type N-terminal cleavage/methylation domain-containing protein
MRDQLSLRHPALITYSRQRGFSIIEMAVVLLVITLLLGSLLVPLATQVEQRQVSETERALEEIREALLGFAAAKGYLPCPDRATGGTGGANDTANDGVEDFNAAGNCTAPNGEGNLPWATLGVVGTDVWGNRFHYEPATTFAQRAPAATFTLTSTSASLRVCTTNACTTQLTVAGDGPVAVVFSHGKNGFGAINGNTGTANPAPTSPDEQGNTDGGSNFNSRAHTRAGSPAGEYDDILIWISKNALFNRMVAAGRLP